MTYNVICQRCGFQYKNFQLRKEPRTELMVCEYCYDPAHPQDFVTAKSDLQQVPYVRPDNTTVSVEVDINETTQTDVPSGTFNSNNNTL
jgi:NAD-dependent SIR2 family protein deacetylase